MPLQDIQSNVDEQIELYKRIKNDVEDKYESFKYMTGAKKLPPAT